MYALPFLFIAAYKIYLVKRGNNSHQIQALRKDFLKREARAGQSVSQMLANIMHFESSII